MGEKTKDAFVTEVELDSGRVFQLRTVEMDDWDQAAQAAALRSADNQMLFSMNTQQELLKRLIVTIDGKEPTGIERESLKAMLQPAEFFALMAEVQNLMGKCKVVRQGQVKRTGASSRGSADIRA